MKREDVKTFLKDGCNAVNCSFDAGRLTEFNSLQDKSFPFVWWETEELDNDSFGGTGSTLIDDRAITLHISKQDTMDSLQEEYENIVNECDQIARKLLWQYNRVLYSDSSSVSATATLSDNTTLKRSAYSRITLKSISRTPFIKKHGDCLSGIILKFVINSPDLVNVCP